MFIRLFTDIVCSRQRMKMALVLAPLQTVDLKSKDNFPIMLEKFTWLR